MKVQILHNPRCSKSRATLQLLREHGIEPEVILYLEKPPGEKQIQSILDMLGLEPRELMRTGQAEYHELQLDDPRLSDATLIAAMHQTPILIERPIVLAGKRAAIGRPPEKVLALL